jgi:hypothetical protein|tara:strand:- start:534 stop:1094 length:561 start_codon:yes stop_codon:yes gene_type:complete
MNKEITFESKKGFNKSSKIIAFKLGVNASLILSSLIYKHNYWFSKNKLINMCDEPYFFITYLNLEAETLIKQSAIKKAIIELKKTGLIKVKRKGLPATNHYHLNECAINDFEAKYEHEYLEWTKGLKSIAKADRERLDEYYIIHNNDKKVVSKSASKTQDLEYDLIEQMRESMSTQTHSSGLNYMS